MTTARTASQIGRSNRARGASFERAVTTAVRPWFTDARRSRDNGSSTTSDTGDLTDAGPCWWSCKTVRAAESSPPALIDAWHAEAVAKAGGLIPVIVQKRAGHADPLRSWCWVQVVDMAELLAQHVGVTSSQWQVATTAGWARIELRGWLDLLAATGNALTPDGGR